MLNVLYLPPSLWLIGIDRWLKAIYSRVGGFDILVDLLIGYGIGVGGDGIGFATGVDLGEGCVWLAAGVRVMSEVESAFLSILVGIMWGVVSFHGVWGGVEDELLVAW